MKKNFLNKNLVIYKIKNQGSFLTPFLLLLTLRLGWVFFNLKFMNNKQLSPLLIGYLRLYKFHFKIKGFGFKWKYFLRLKQSKSFIYLKVGLTHRLVFLILKNCKCKIKKKRLILYNRSYNFLRNAFFLLFFYFQTYIYNKKGIYLRGTKWKLKLSKKKSKF